MAEPFVKVNPHIEDDVAILGHDAFIVYVVLGAHVNGKRLAWPSQSYLSQKTQLSRSQVQRSLAKLESLGYIGKSPEGAL